MGICGSSGSACTSGSLDPSHVLLAIGLPHEIAHGSLRLTLSEENTMEEMDYVAEKMKGRPLDTVYFGGGTPTSLSPEDLDAILDKVERTFPMDQVKEFTVEAGRPDSITEEKLQVLRNHGITRISINPQTMNQKTLDLIGRHHTVDMVKDRFYMARELGFDNINMDLIMGLPEENMDDVRRTLEEVKALAPDSLTVHSLAIKRAGQAQHVQGRVRRG